MLWVPEAARQIVHTPVICLGFYVQTFLETAKAALQHRQQKKASPVTKQSGKLHRSGKCTRTKLDLWCMICSISRHSTLKQCQAQAASIFARQVARVLRKC